MSNIIALLSPKRWQKINKHEHETLFSGDEDDDSGPFGTLFIIIINIIIHFKK